MTSHIAICDGGCVVGEVHVLERGMATRVVVKSRHIVQYVTGGERDG